MRKVTLKAMEAIRRFQQNPNLGEYRIHAALDVDGVVAIYTYEDLTGAVELIARHPQGWTARQALTYLQESLA